MNTLVIVLIAAVCLIAAYALYGRWLAKKWGIDPKAKTPAVLHNDGQDYVPTDGWTVFAHQFSSIAGAGPVTGAIQAAAFGWLPVLLWIILGGIFFGAVTDFGALYASVKNDGKSMGLLIEKYIGKAGRKRHMGIRPTVRGSVMNPNDHPHGGGEGKTGIGRPGPCTPWGKPALGLKTRKKKKASNKLIVRRRDGKAIK